MNWQWLFSPCPSFFFFIPKSHIIGLSAFVNLIMRRGHWKYPLTQSERAGKDRENWASCYLCGSWNVFYHLFSWWMGNIPELLQSISPRRNVLWILIQYESPQKVIKQSSWLSIKMHKCSIKEKKPQKRSLCACIFMKSWQFLDFPTWS